MKETSLQRAFDAPIEIIWKCLSEEEMLKKWYVPEGFKLEIMEMTFDEGGGMFSVLKNPDGFELYQLISFRKIDSPRKLELTHSFSNSGREIVRHPMFDKWPLEVINRFTLEPLDNRTMITLELEPLNATEEEEAVHAENVAHVIEGFQGYFRNLDGLIKSSVEIS